eukprot:m51a1_g11024 Conserved oligomeric Golgi complex subunit 5 (793) ;mRNA; r:410154-412793
MSATKTPPRTPAVPDAPEAPSQAQQAQQAQQVQQAMMDARAVLAALPRGSPLEQSLERLSAAVNDLNFEIDRRVAEHYEELLGQASALRDAAAAIREISEGAAALHAALARVRNELLGPYERIKTRTVQLQSLHDGAEMLRKVLKFAHLLRRLKDGMGVNDLAKSAATHSEIMELLRDSELRGVEAVEAAREGLARDGESLLQAAERTLARGLEAQNQADVSTALTAYRHLNRLDDGTHAALAAALDRFTSVVTSATASAASDFKQAAAGAVGSSATQAQAQAQSSLEAAARAALWPRLAQIGEAAWVACGQAWTLGSVMASVREDASQRDAPVRAFWKSASRAIGEKLCAAARSTPTLELALVTEYPRLLKSLQDTVARCAPSLVAIPEAEETLLAAVAPFERAFLAQSLARMTDPLIGVNRSGAASVGSTESSIQAFVRVVAAEIGAASGSARLAEGTAKNVDIAIKMFLSKVEPLISSEQDAYQVRERMTAAQLQNAVQFQALVTAHSALVPHLTAACQWMPPTASSTLTTALALVEAIADKCVGKLFDNATKVLEASLYLMHSEDFGGESLSAGEDPGVSSYIQTVDKQLRHFQTQFVSRLAPCPLITSRTTALVSRVISLFVRHASLVRPLGTRGKLRLTNDMALLEQGVQRLQAARAAGEAYRHLRALRPLMMRDIREFPECPEARVLPPSVVAHHALSRAPSELASPHAFLRMSLAQYIEALDVWSEEEIWSKIQATLEAYAENVNRRGGKEFSPVYPVLTALGPQLVAAWQQQQPRTHPLIPSQ